jgi:hypothetical protein
MMLQIFLKNSAEYLKIMLDVSVSILVQTLTKNGKSVLIRHVGAVIAAQKSPIKICLPCFMCTQFLRIFEIYNNSNGNERDMLYHCVRTMRSCTCLVP